MSKAVYKQHTERGYAPCGCGIPSRAAYRAEIRWRVPQADPDVTHQGVTHVYMCEAALADYEERALMSGGLRDREAAKRLLGWDGWEQAEVTEVTTVRQR